MKIVLINPPYFLTTGRFEKNALYTEPPLGIAYIAAYLKKYAREVEVSIIDAATLGLGYEYMLDEIARADIVGCTTVTATAKWVKDFLCQVKHEYPSILTVVGGAHPTALPFDLLPEADICVIGEGEATAVDIVDYWRGLIPIGVIKGIAYQKDGVNKINGCREYIKDLDTIPYPDWELLPMDYYRHQMPYKTKTKRYATVMTARGCPFSCSFCGVKKMWGRQVRYRSVKNIVLEVAQLVELYDVSFVFFFDDTITANRSRIIEICKGIKPLGIKWACFSRVDGIDEELLRVMKASGCAEIQIGVESGDPAILEKINKGITIAQAERAFKLTKKVGINTKGFFMIGNEGETPESVNKTIKLALKLNPTYGFFSVLIPFPALPVYDRYKALGYINTFDWGEYNWYGYPVFSTPLLSASQMKALQRKAEIRFYLRPAKALGYLRDAVRSGKIKTLVRNIFIFANIVTYKKKETADAK